MEQNTDRTLAMSNDVILSNLTGTPAQNSLLIQLFAEIRMNDEGFEYLEFDLTKELKTNSLQEVNTFVARLRSMEFKLKMSDTKDMHIPVFGQIIHDKGKRTMEAVLSESFKPLLLGLERNFTQIKESHAIAMNTGTYEYKLFTILKAKSLNGRNKSWKVKIGDFRWQMGIGDGKYREMTNLTKKVINPAVKGAKKYFTGLAVEKIKKGRSVKELLFTWKSEKRGKFIPKQPNSRDDTKHQVIVLHPSESSKTPYTGLNHINSIREKLNREKIGRNVYESGVKALRKAGFSENEITVIMCLPNNAPVKARQFSEKSNLKNPIGYVKKMLKEECRISETLYNRTKDAL